MPGFVLSSRTTEMRNSSPCLQGVHGWKISWQGSAVIKVRGCSTMVRVCWGWEAWSWIQSGERIDASREPNRTGENEAIQEPGLSIRTVRHGIVELAKEGRVVIRGLHPWRSGFLSCNSSQWGQDPVGSIQRSDQSERKVKSESHVPDKSSVLDVSAVS